LPLRALVVGADGVTLHRQTKAWLAQYLTSEGESLDSDRWDAAALSPESLHDALQSLPMLQSVRVLVIHHVENLKKEADSVLDAFLDDPNPHLALLLTGSKVDQRKRWVKKVKDQDGLVDCPLPKRHQWLGWLRAQGTELNVDITEDAAHLLVEWVGEDPWRLFQELHKLSDYVGEVRRIQLRDVETMVAGLPAADIFQTLDATFEGRAYEGMQGLRRLLRHDEPALRIHAMFIRHARILLNLRLWMAQGVRNPQELAPKLGVHPFFVRHYRNRGRF
jgi:DNA polymerase-3 subunit delta